MQSRFVACSLLALSAGLVCSQTIPFGSHPAGMYPSWSIQPTIGSASDRDAAVAAFYETWKQKYLTYGCGNGAVYVAMSSQQTVSEAHGYGMVILSLMAGHDGNAKQLFDGMVTYWKQYRSAIDSGLMSWKQYNCASVDGINSATDGDFDIALGLLMAAAQWPDSQGTYHNDAVQTISSMLQSEVSVEKTFSLLGDWAKGESGKYGHASRASDWMLGHFAQFAKATNDDSWTQLIQALLKAITSASSSSSPGTHLMPDFFSDVTSNPPTVAPAGFLEGDYDGAYSYNACRYPWRLGVYAMEAGDETTMSELSGLNTWIRFATGNQPSQISAGYYLNGSPLPGRNYPSMAFMAPFAVSAMVSSANQDWLNALWSLMVSTPSQGYYEDTIRLLCMIIVSGNWWTAAKVTDIPLRARLTPNTALTPELDV